MLSNLDTIIAMSRHGSFSFKSGADLRKKAEELGRELPFQDSISPLFESIEVNSKKILNRLAVQPMEGFDAELDGSPSQLTFRRYSRYAEGGSGLIWFEATSVVPEGRSNPRQLMLFAQNLDTFKRLVEQTRNSAFKVFGSSFDIFCVLQLTHSGRHSKPKGKPKPYVANPDASLGKKAENTHVLSDEDLARLQNIYVETARLAGEAGFDGVDIKACNGYLLNELLAAYLRKNSRYGESFENRTRFLLDVLQDIRGEVPGICTAVRLSAYDGIPYGFGVLRDGSIDIDLNEPKELLRHLIRSGCSLFNITVGNPYHEPHFGRPFDRPLPGASLPDEHPLEGVTRLLKVTGVLQKEFPDIPFVGTGYSWLRHFFPYVGAAVLNRKEVSFVGLGRSSFAYPDAPRDLMAKGVMDPKKACITCSRCTELMRNGHISGCAAHDKKIYEKEYQELLLKETRDEEEPD